MWIPVSFDAIATVRLLGQFTLAGLNVRAIGPPSAESEHQPESLKIKIAPRSSMFAFHQRHATPHRAAAFNSLHVSCLAQTQEPAPVILYSPECVYGAATADSQLSFLGHRRR